MEIIRYFQREHEIKTIIKAKKEIYKKASEWSFWARTTQRFKKKDLRKYSWIFNGGKYFSVLTIFFNSRGVS